MKKTKLFISLCTVLLSVAGFIAMKANSKRIQFNQACFVGMVGTFHALAHLTSINNEVNDRTCWLVIRSTIGGSIALHTAVT